MKKNLVYTTAVMKESLRYFGPTSYLMNRLVKKSFTLGKFEIPKGVLINVLLHSIMRNPKHFENPDSFNPERWLTTSINDNMLAWIPFSMGPRNCIG